MFIVHVGGTRCVTSSTDQIMNIHARIPLTVECIRTCLFVFLMCTYNYEWDQYSPLFDLQADVRVNDYQKDSIVDILGRNHQGVPNNWRTRPEDGGEEEGKGEVVEVVEMDDSGSSEEERCGLFCPSFYPLFSSFPHLLPILWSSL